MSAPLDIAIVGRGCVFPDAPSPRELWNLVRSGRHAVRAVPAERWGLNPAGLLHPDSGRLDAVCSRSGCLVDQVPLGHVPASLRAALEPLDPQFHLAVAAGFQAWQDAELAGVAPHRVGIVLGNIVLPTEATSAFTRSWFRSRGRVPTDVDRLNRQAGGGPVTFLADALDVRGPALAVDAACASSLYAVKLAIDELEAGRLDVVLAGGLARPDHLFCQMGFNALRALSTRGLPAPFDQGGDGLVVGEGAGVIVLMRREEADRAGKRVRAVIRGLGLSNDREGKLLAPSSEGQLRAMRAAYAQAGWQPWDVDLIECHATGTPLGDAVEFASLRELWRDRTDPSRGLAILGSCKSNFGHTLTAAGAAGIIKVVEAMAARELPPTANFQEPQRGVELADSPFRILKQAQAWPEPAADRPRRAAVSAFGFGGINAHLLLEAPDASRAPMHRTGGALGASSATQPPTRHRPAPEAVAIVGIGLRLGPLTDLATAASTWIEGQPPEPVPDGVAFDPVQFRLPPAEVDSLLPQQVLMLAAAEDARQDAAWNPDAAERTGIFLGVELDWNTTNFSQRWHRRAEGDADPGVPPLTAERTLGALASIIASRLARAWKVGGPSFTMMGGRSVVLDALRAAVTALSAHQIDQAVVGVVELLNDPREQAQRGAVQPPAWDGAVALVLRRAADASSAGTRVYATVALAEAIQGGAEPVAAVLGTGLDQWAELGRCGPLAQVAAAALALHLWIRRGADGRPIPWLAGNDPRRVLVGTTPNLLLISEAVGAVPTEVANAGPKAEATLPSRRPARFFVLAGDDAADLNGQLDRLCAAAAEAASVEPLGSNWHAATADRRSRPLRWVLALRTLDELPERAHALRTASATSGPGWARTPSDVPRGELAFVFPGSGQGWAEPGRELLLSWPGLVAEWERHWLHLRDHFGADRWGTSRPTDPPPSVAEQILHQVSFGAFVAGVVRQQGLEPDATIGYSLGETTALVALGCWPDRDELCRRVQSSPLFQTELAGPCTAARRAWKLPPDVHVNWMTYLVAAPAAEVRKQLAGRQRVYLVAENAPAECVVGGQAEAVQAFLAEARLAGLPLPTTSTVHCPVAAEVADAYRAFHNLPTRAPGAVRVYGTAVGQTYGVGAAAAADAVTATALQPIDFPRVIRQAFADGVRTFLEVGPGASCTRMIKAILADQPHTCLAAQPTEELRKLEEALCLLFALGHGWPRFPSAGSVSGQATASRTQRKPVHVRLHPQAFPLPAPAASATEPSSESPPPSPWEGDRRSPLAPMLAVLAERSAAHEQFFRFQEAWQRTAAQVAIASIPAGSESVATADRPTDLPIWSPPAAVPRALDRPACLEFARGQIGNVLGPSFAHVDGYPTRVRLPDEPLMLVDRILQIEGTPQSLGAGRVVTEHDVLPGDWYLDQGRMPTSITVESGQADLFLAGFLGIDDRTRGQAVYRLLDAVVTFHAGLPRAGQTVRYDIQIERFFEQGGVYLFRFGFEGTVEGQPLLSMRDGCAGFFTPEALAAGRGLVAPATPQPPRPGRGLAAGEWFHEPPAVLDGTQVNAIYAGDLAGGLGPAFASLPQFRPLVPPGSRLKLVDRVTHQSRSGGRFGNGLVRAEAAVPPDAWYLTCHFVDDQVMPGTLMYECCLHTLRLYLLSLGWVGSEAGESWAEPVPGVASRLKCRGQVTSATRLVEYEVHIREIGLEPEAYAVGDAVMFADGKPIVEIGDLSLRLQGVTRGELDRFWAKTRVGSHAMSFPPSSSEAWPAARSSEPSRRPALFDRERILAFAVGKPSEAFGPPYAVFDQERVIARLPGPPYQFLDRIVAIEGEPWQMRAGGVVEAEYDVPADAWYLAANRQPAMPFAVLLEVALQPCGWLAAYVGSALTSPVDLSFRNLGGSALVSREVTAASGTLTTRVKLTNVSASGGMIIQHYDFAVRSSEGAVLEGQTYFGFFTKAALAQQVGLRDAQLAEVTPGPGWPMPRQAPFPDDRLRMIETMDTLDTAQGGQYGLGLAAGHKRVDPNEWFFAAHFHQDPVQPGSLGLEGFLQLVKAWAATRWRVQARSRFVTPVPSHRFEWTYRGQVVPGHGVVQVQASPQAVDDERRLVTAAGVLSVDGRPIYAMSGFTLQVCD